MNQQLYNVLWIIFIFCAVLLLGLIGLLIGEIKRSIIEKIANKKDKKLFDKVIYGLLNSKQSNKHRGNPIINIDNMTGIEFERFLKEMFKTLGYRVKKTPDSGDYGADLYMEKDGKIYIVQAKRYRDKVSLPAVQEVVAAKSYYKADVCMVVTNSYLTENAKILAKNNNVIVYERPDLIKLIEASRTIIEKGKQIHNTSNQSSLRKGRAL